MRAMLVAQPEKGTWDLVSPRAQVAFREPPGFYEGCKPDVEVIAAHEVTLESSGTHDS